MSRMERRFKHLILDTTESCPELHDFLKSSKPALDWIGKRGAETLFNFALALDDTFGEQLLSMVLRQ